MRIKMKKEICLTLVGLLGGIMLTACGTTNYAKLLDKDSPVTITVWHYYNGIQQIQFDEMVNEFNNTTGKELGIIVEANSKNSINELSQSVLAAVNHEPGADELPDIYGNYAETAYQIDKLGMLVDLSKYMTEEELGEYVEEYMEEGSLGQEGALKIFPTAKSTEIMMLNLTDWEKFAGQCGVSFEDMTTWEGLAAVAEQYYEYTDSLTPDIANDGKAFFGRDSLANYMLVGAKQLGNEFVTVSKDGTLTASVDKETMRKLWDNYYVPYVKGYYKAENRFRTDDAKIGSIIALVGSTTGATYYPTEVTINDDYTYPIENVVLPVPNFEGYDSYIVQQGAGMSVLKSNEKTEYACVVFLKWLTQAQRNIQFSINSGYLPVKEEANNFEDIAHYGKEEGISDTMLNTFQVAIDEINSSTLYTSIPYENSAQVRDYIADKMQDTAKEANAAASERISRGEDRDSVWESYTDDKAFDTWFEKFEQGFYEITGQ